MTNFQVLAFTIALSIPLASTTSAQSYRTARDVLEANVEVMGGEKAWGAVRSLRVETEMEMDGPVDMGRITSTTMIYPGYRFSESEIFIPGANQIQSTKILLTPDGGWMEGPEGREKLEKPDGAGPTGGPRHALEELGFLQSDLSLNLLDNKQIDGRDAYVVQIGDGEEAPKRFYDTDTLFLIAQEMRTNMGGNIMRHLDDYREVDGIYFAHRQEIDSPMGGKQTEITSSITVNIPITVEELLKLAGEE